MLDEYNACHIWPLLNWVVKCSYKWMSNFVKCFLGVYWDLTIFLFHFMNMVSYIDWFVYVELYCRDKCAAEFILLVFCWEFFSSVFIRDQYWPVVFFSSPFLSLICCPPLKILIPKLFIKADTMDNQSIEEIFWVVEEFFAPLHFIEWMYFYPTCTYSLLENK